MSGFVFITSPQVVAPNVISHPITIQSQDSSGSPAQVSETYALSFTSSSPTGQFVTSTGKKISTSTTMSKNTANRTVYYEDGTVGNFVLSLVATARTSKQVFTATQPISIAVSAPIVPSVTRATVEVTASASSSRAVPNSSAASQVVSTSHVEMSAVSATSTVSQTADASATVFIAPPRTDVIHRIFAWPITWCDAIYRFFFGQ